MPDVHHKTEPSAPRGQASLRRRGTGPASRRIAAVFGAFLLLAPVAAAVPPSPENPTAAETRNETDVRLAEAFRSRDRKALRELSRTVPLDRLNALIPPEEWTVLFSEAEATDFLRFLFSGYYTPHAGLFRALAQAAPLNEEQAAAADMLLDLGAGVEPDRFPEPVPPVFALTVALARKGMYTERDLAFCRKLLDIGFGVDEPDASGITPREMAAALPAWRTELLKLGAKPGLTTFSPKAVKLYTALHRTPFEGISPEEIPDEETINRRWPDGDRPLLFAIDQLKEFSPARLEAVRLLLRAGADPNLTDRKGGALHHLFETSPDAQLMLLPELLKAGADVNDPGPGREAPVFTLFRNSLTINQKRLILRLLLSQSLDLSVRSAAGEEIAAAAPPALRGLLQRHSAAATEKLRKEALPRTAGERRSFTASGVTFHLRSCPPGSFTMGSAPGTPGRRNDEPLHPVELTYGYWLGETEVSQQFYKALTGKNPSRWQSPGAPVEQVSWDEAMAFCEKLNSALQSELPTGYAFRLPTEAEWEYAARAGESFRFSGSDDYREVAVIGTPPAESGTRKPNKWGFFDLSGNVAEWCFDPPSPYGGGRETAVDPVGTGRSDRRIHRGGSVFDTGQNGAELRTAARRSEHRKQRQYKLGFRIALAPELKPGGEFRKADSPEERFAQPESEYAYAFPERGRNGGIAFRLNPETFSDGATCSVWVRPGTVSAANQTIFRMRSASGEVRRLAVGGANLGFLFWEESADTPRGVVGHSPLPADRWSNVVLTMDDTTFAVYCNGSLVCSGRFQNPGLFRPEEFCVGSNSTDERPEKSPARFTGEITDVALWNRALAPTEIQPDSQRKIRTGLLGCWGFSRGQFNAAGGGTLRATTIGNPTTVRVRR